MATDDSDDTGPKKVRPRWMDPNYDRFKRSKKHEQRLAKRLGGKRLPQSGAQRLSKYAVAAQTDLAVKPPTITQNGDLALPDFWVEHKRTDTGTMSIKREWWQKVCAGAREASREPAILITFETPHSPSSKPIDLALIPLDVFERLRGAGK